MTRPTMTCPQCGATMNHHAEKAVQPVSAEEAAAVTASVDGVLELMFACPRCGRIESRRETAENPPS